MTTGIRHVYCRQATEREDVSSSLSSTLRGSSKASGSSQSFSSAPSGQPRGNQPAVSKAQNKSTSSLQDLDPCVLSFGLSTVQKLTDLRQTDPAIIGFGHAKVEANARYSAKASHSFSILDSVFSSREFGSSDGLGAVIDRSKVEKTISPSSTSILNSLVSNGQVVASAKGRETIKASSYIYSDGQLVPLAPLSVNHSNQIKKTFDPASTSILDCVLSDGQVVASAKGEEVIASSSYIYSDGQLVPFAKADPLGARKGFQQKASSLGVDVTLPLPKDSAPLNTQTPGFSPQSAQAAKSTPATSPALSPKFRLTQDLPKLPVAVGQPSKTFEALDPAAPQSGCANAEDLRLPWLDIEISSRQHENWYDVQNRMVSSEQHAPISYTPVVALTSTSGLHSPDDMVLRLTISSQILEDRLMLAKKIQSLPSFAIDAKDFSRTCEALDVIPHDLQTWSSACQNHLNLSLAAEQKPQRQHSVPSELSAAASEAADGVEIAFDEASGQLHLVPVYTHASKPDDSGAAIVKDITQNQTPSDFIAPTLRFEDIDLDALFGQSATDLDEGSEFVQVTDQSTSCTADQVAPREDTKLTAGIGPYAIASNDENYDEAQLLTVDHDEIGSQPQLKHTNPAGVADCLEKKIQSRRDEDAFLAQANEHWDCIKEDLVREDPPPRRLEKGPNSADVMRELMGLEQKRKPVEPIKQTTNPERRWIRPIHHYNILQTPVHHASSTPSAVSFWAVLASDYKEQIEDETSWKAVVSAQAAKLVDPCIFESETPIPACLFEEDNATKLREHLIGLTKISYEPLGAWLADPYDLDQETPQVTNTWARDVLDKDTWSHWNYPGLQRPSFVSMYDVDVQGSVGYGGPYSCSGVNRRKKSQEGPKAYRHSNLRYFQNVSTEEDIFDNQENESEAETDHDLDIESRVKASVERGIIEESTLPVTANTSRGGQYVTGTARLETSLPGDLDGLVTGKARPIEPTLSNDQAANNTGITTKNDDVESHDLAQDVFVATPLWPDELADELSFNDLEQDLSEIHTGGSVGPTSEQTSNQSPTVVTSEPTNVLVEAEDILARIKARYGPVYCRCIASDDESSYVSSVDPDWEADKVADHTDTWNKRPDPAAHPKNFELAKWSEEPISKSLTQQPTEAATTELSKLASLARWPERPVLLASDPLHSGLGAESSKISEEETPDAGVTDGNSYTDQGFITADGGDLASPPSVGARPSFAEEAPSYVSGEKDDTVDESTFEYPKVYDLNGRYSSPSKMLDSRIDQSHTPAQSPGKDENQGSWALGADGGNHTPTKAQAEPFITEDDDSVSEGALETIAAAMTGVTRASIARILVGTVSTPGSGMRLARGPVVLPGLQYNPDDEDTNSAAMHAAGSVKVVEILTRVAVAADQDRQILLTGKSFEEDNAFGPDYIQTQLRAEIDLGPKDSMVESVMTLEVRSPDSSGELEYQKPCQLSNIMLTTVEEGGSETDSSPIKPKKPNAMCRLRKTSQVSQSFNDFRARNTVSRLPQWTNAEFNEYMDERYAQELKKKEGITTVWDPELREEMMVPGPARSTQNTNGSSKDTSQTHSRESSKQFDTISPPSSIAEEDAVVNERMIYGEGEAELPEPFDFEEFNGEENVAENDALHSIVPQNVSASTLPREEMRKDQAPSSVIPYEVTISAPLAEAHGKASSTMLRVVTAGDVLEAESSVGLPVGVELAVGDVVEAENDIEYGDVLEIPDDRPNFPRAFYGDASIAVWHAAFGLGKWLVRKCLWHG